MNPYPLHENHIMKSYEMYTQDLLWYTYRLSKNAIEKRFKVLLVTKSDLLFQLYLLKRKVSLAKPFNNFS